MVVKEFFGTIALLIGLAGGAYLIYRGDETVKVIGAGGDALANAIVAATPRGPAK